MDEQSREQFRRDEEARQFNTETNRFWNNFYWQQSWQAERDAERAASAGRENSALLQTPNDTAWQVDVGSAPDYRYPRLDDSERTPPVDAAGAGEGVRALAAERDARETYDFWSAFYRSQDQIALNAERSHERNLEAARRAEEGRVAGGEQTPTEPIQGLEATGPVAAITSPVPAEIFADPALRDLLPADPADAQRLLADLGSITSGLEEAARCRAAGDEARAKAAERDAREIYDFWSAFYRSQDQIALIAERMHELNLEAARRAEEGRVASGELTKSEPNLGLEATEPVAAISPSVPAEVLADPALRDLLPADPADAQRLLADLVSIVSGREEAARCRAAGDEARAKAAERDAREIYDFWSAFYRSQDQIALIAERMHELNLEAARRAEDARLVGSPKYDAQFMAYATRAYSEPFTETPALERVWEMARAGQRSTEEGFKNARENFWWLVNEGEDRDSLIVRDILTSAGYELQGESRAPRLKVDFDGSGREELSVRMSRMDDDLRTRLGDQLSKAAEKDLTRREASYVLLTIDHMDAQSNAKDRRIDPGNLRFLTGWDNSVRGARFDAQDRHIGADGKSHEPPLVETAISLLTRIVAHVRDGRCA